MTEALPLNAAIPLWAMIPFAVYLLTIAVTPLIHAHFWESNRNKLFTALLISAPVLLFLLRVHPHGTQSTLVFRLSARRSVLLDLALVWTLVAG